MAEARGGREGGNDARVLLEAAVIIRKGMRGVGVGVGDYCCAEAVEVVPRFRGSAGGKGRREGEDAGVRMRISSYLKCNNETKQSENET